MSARREEQHQLLLRALDVLLEVHVRRGILPEARCHAYQLVALEPYRESGYCGALMRAQLAAGDRADALKTYERARSLLLDELGVLPGSELGAVHEEGLTADAPATAAGGDAHEAQSQLPTGTVTLVLTKADPIGSEEARRAHLTLVRACAAMTGGHEVKELDAGLMIAFAAASDAVQTGIAIQQAVAHQNRVASTGLGSARRHSTGEPTLANGDYFGVPVAVATRLCAAAADGQILASEAVRVLTGSAATFADRRDLVLEDMTDATPTWSVVWRPWAGTGS